MRECEQGVVARDRVHHSCCDDVRALEFQGIHRIQELAKTAAEWEARYESALVQLDAMKLQNQGLQKENAQLTNDMGTVKQAREMTDRAMASARTWEAQANETRKECNDANRQIEKLTNNLKAATSDMNLYEQRWVDAERLVGRMQNALEDIITKTVTAHDGGAILPIRNMAQRGLGLTERPNNVATTEGRGCQLHGIEGHDCAEKRVGSSPTERPCCVEAYARGYEMGKAAPREQGSCW